MEPVGPADPQARRWTKIALGALLAAAVATAYWPSLGNEFVNYDDNEYVTDNPRVQQGITLAALRWAWTTGWAGNWFPLTWMSHMLDWQLYGSWAEGHHATSLALHVANTLLVFGLLSGATGAVWRSALVAGLFGLHPLRVESVAWIAERKDVLSACLFLLALWAYGRWVRRGGVGRYVLVMAALALSLTAKQMAVTLPCALVLLDVWPLGRLRSEGLWRLVREKLPLVPLVAAAAAVTMSVQAAGGMIGDTEANPLAVRVANAIVAYATYLWKTVWPTDLIVLYVHRGAPAAGVLVVSALVLALVTALAWRERERRPYLLVGWLWYLGTLVPVIGLVPIGRHAFADRYTYLPLLGVFTALAWLLPGGRAARPIAAVAVAVLAALGARTTLQTRVWHDPVSLFTRALALDERSPIAHVNLGYGLLDRGQPDQAIAHFERALELEPGNAKPRVGLGNILLERGRTDEALAQFTAAAQADPRSVHALTNIGFVLAGRGRFAEAIPLYERALAVRPDFYPALNNLGLALAQTGRLPDARVWFERAVAVDPHQPDALANLGALNLREGRLSEALAYCERVLALKPGDPGAHGNRLLALIELGRHADAWAAVREARAAGVEPSPDVVRALAARAPP
jgi:Flp pilus assembly protein TadD